MVRAVKEGAAIGPAHGSLRSYMALVILSVRELKVLSKISGSVPESIRIGGYDDLGPRADVSTEPQSISRVCCSGRQPRPFRREGGRLH